MVCAWKPCGRRLEGVVAQRRYCSLLCRNRAKEQRRGPRVRDTAEGRARVRAFRIHLQGDPCAYCGGVAEQLDHISPCVLGKQTGKYTWANLTAACTECNHAKGTRSLLGYLLLRSIGPEYDAVKAYASSK
jgi:5-methylcytosine-specific restriction endonuclease McrA